MTTRKQLLTEKYNQICEELTKSGLFETNVLPNLTDIDIVDVIFFFQLSFPDSDKYEEAIHNMLKFQNIKLNDVNKKKVVDIIIPLLDLFRQLT